MGVPVVKLKAMSVDVLHTSTVLVVLDTLTHAYAGIAPDALMIGLFIVVYRPAWRMVRRPAVPGVNSVVTCTNSQPLVLRNIVWLSVPEVTRSAAADGVEVAATGDGFKLRVINACKVPNDVTVVCDAKVKLLMLSNVCGIPAAKSGQ